MTVLSPIPGTWEHKFCASLRRRFAVMGRISRQKDTRLLHRIRAVSGTHYSEPDHACDETHGLRLKKSYSWELQS